MGTPELILKFDSVNSSKQHSPKKLTTHLTETSKHVNFFNEAIAFISRLKVFVRTNQHSQTLVHGETDYQENSSSMVQQNAIRYM